MGVVSCGTTMLDQGVFNNIGAVTWDTTAKTSGFTAVSGNGYFVNTTSASITVTLPSSPAAGAIVGIKDYANTADTNKIIIARNGSNIQGTADDFDIVTEGGSVLLVYVDGTQGWKVTSASQASDITNAAFISATGGTITTDGDYKVHTFTGPGTFTVSSVGNPIGSDSVDYLVVAGGGGTGYGGGGAGGFREGYNPGSYTASPLATSALPVSATGYPITVGGGGSAGPSGGGSDDGGGNSGSNSVFSTITSAGGGGGGGKNPPGPNAGKSGGSGGGATFDGSQPAGGAGNTPPVSPPQGNNGGGAPGGAAQVSGGGGGATQVGETIAGQGKGGDGGDGAGTAINPGAGTPGPNGSLRYFSGGGAGGANTPGGTPGPASGGVGGGGSNPGADSHNGSSGTANTGGGASGKEAEGSNGAAGGSGIVIIRYKFQ